MATQVWRLQMRAPLRVGAGRGIAEEALPYIPSDTLFSALVVTWLETTQHRAVVDTLRDAFAAQPPLLLTSAFPYAGDVYLLPRPRLPLYPQLKDGDSVKKVKRVSWVSAAIFAELISGIDQEQMNTRWAGAALIQDGTIWVTKEEATRLAQILEADAAGEHHVWSNLTVPRVAVNRVDNASNLFHMQRVHFAPEAGLWLAAQSPEQAWLDRVTDALHLLADSGIGGQRSRGNGQFTLDTEPPPLPLPLDTANQAKADGYCVLLSRLAPSVDEMALLKADNASYDLVTVGGHNGTPWDQPLVRQSLRLLKEGSVIGAARAWPGQLVNVNPYWDDEKQQVPETVDRTNPKIPIIEHAIHRYGFGFTLPVVMNQLGAPAG